MGHRSLAAFPILRAVGVVLLLPLTATLSPTAGLAQSSAYVPNLDPAYADLDALFAAGLVDVHSMAQRPYSRMTFARFAAGARVAFLEGSSEGRIRFYEALERLEARFASEISLLCGGGGGLCGRAGPGFSLRSAELDVTSAASPDRPVRTSYEAPLAASPVLIAADVNPLLQRNQGRVLADGQTAAVETTIDVQLAPSLALQVRPRVSHSRATGRTSDQDATLLDAYVRGVFGGVALEVGRNHVATGHGRMAGPASSGVLEYLTCTDPVLFQYNHKRVGLLADRCGWSQSFCGSSGHD